MCDCSLTNERMITQYGRNETSERLFIFGWTLSLTSEFSRSSKRAWKRPKRSSAGHGGTHVLFYDIGSGLREKNHGFASISRINRDAPATCVQRSLCQGTDS